MNSLNNSLLVKNIAISLVLIISSLFCAEANAQQDKALVLHINGAIGPAIAEYIHEGFRQAKLQEAKLVVIELNTPGGLDLSMREITQDILASKIPVVTYVAPAGSRAASAGTFILYASNIAAMAPGTNLGAASPVAVGGASEEGNSDTMLQKAKNDAGAYIRSLAELRKRNVKWAEKAVTEADSITAEQALAQNVIDIIAVDMQDLLQQLQHKAIIQEDTAVVKFEPDWRNRLLATITDPNIAYILLMIGVYGLLLEFYNPGTILPGVVGVISILLGAYALQFLPISYVGLALLIVGIAFMILEVYVTSFGILATGGVVAFIVGSILLIDTEVPGFKIAMPLIVTMGLTSAAFVIWIATLTLKTFGLKTVSGAQTLLGHNGEVISVQGASYTVKINGELWQAKSDQTLVLGQSVFVKQVNGLRLVVQPAELQNTGES